MYALCQGYQKSKAYVHVCIVLGLPKVQGICTCMHCDRVTKSPRQMYIYVCIVTGLSKIQGVPYLTTSANWSFVVVVAICMLSEATCCHFHSVVHL